MLMLESQQAGFFRRLSDLLLSPPLQNAGQTFIYFIKTIRYFMSWTSWIIHYQNYKYLNMPVATQRRTYVYVIFAPAFAFLSHLLLYYLFHMDNSVHHIQEWAEVVTKEKNVWLTSFNIYHILWTHELLLQLKEYMHLSPVRRSAYTQEDTKYWKHWVIVGITQLLVQVEMTSKLLLFLLSLSAFQFCAPCVLGLHPGKQSASPG